MAVYEKWQSERYNIGCKVWEARCPNCHELVESADPISSNYRFCPYCGFDMKSDFQRVADRRQFTECLMKLKELREENKVLTSECDRLIKEKGELLSKVSGGDVLRICQLEEQLEKAKRLLKAAVDDLNFESQCRNCKYQQTGLDNKCNGCRGNKYEWRYADEALALIVEDGE